MSEPGDCGWNILLRQRDEARAELTRAYDLLTAAHRRGDDLQSALEASERRFAETELRAETAERERDEWKDAALKGATIVLPPTSDTDVVRACRQTVEMLQSEIVRLRARLFGVE